MNSNNSELDELYLADTSNLAGGHADAVFFPESEEEISTLLKECSAKGTRVTASGAGTGMAGGRVPFGGVVLSLSRMNRVIEIDREKKTAIVQPGVILKNLQDEVESLGLLYPPDPTERGGQLGGNVSTNASGARTFKYGPTRNWIAGLHVILSTGERLILRRGENFANGYDLTLYTDQGRKFVVPVPDYRMPSTSKHAAGYYAHPDIDAIDLFIGSEGTLGVVTQITLQLIDLPESLFSGIVFFTDEEKMLDFVEEVRDRSRANRDAADRGEVEKETPFEARALEFIDTNALDFIREKYPTIPEGANGGAIWFEQETGSSPRSEVTIQNGGEEDISERLIGEWAEVIERHTSLMNDSWFGLTEKDQARMREFRHAVPSSAFEFIAQHRMRKFGTDMAVPDSRFREMFAYYRSRLALSGLTNLTWGHIGNSHLHVNLLPEQQNQADVAQQLYNDFVGEALRLGGTVSAEHGIGKIKTHYLRQMYGDHAIEQMNIVRQTLDPAGILGVGTMTE